MQKVDAYQCSVCKSLGTIGQIRACEMRHKKQSEEDREYAAKNKTQREISDKPRMEASSPKEAIALVEKYAKEFLGIDVKFTSYPNRFTPSASNTHNCPIDGATNWHCDKTLSRGYPGFVGQWEGSISKGASLTSHFDDPCIFGGKGFRGFNTGTGSANDKHFGYNGIMFIDDFPKMKALYEEYVPLENKAKAFNSEELKRLSDIQTAINNAINTDEELDALDRQLDELNAKIATRQENIEKTIKKSMKEYLVLPESFQYNTNRFDKLEQLFGGK
jgi:hypothetical protein